MRAVRLSANRRRCGLSVGLAEGRQCGSDSARLPGQAVLFVLQQLDDSSQICSLLFPPGKDCSEVQSQDPDENIYLRYVGFLLIAGEHFPVGGRCELPFKFI